MNQSDAPESAHTRAQRSSAFALATGVAALCSTASADAKVVQDLCPYVDMTIGVNSNASNCPPGAQLPHASIGPGPVTLNPPNDGYAGNQQIHGFGQIFAQGTGWWNYANLVVTPQIGLAIDAAGRASPKSTESMTNTRYSVTLTRYNTQTDIVPSAHGALYEFTFPTATDSTISLDLAYALDAGSSGYGHFNAGTLSLDPTNATITGSSKYLGNQDSHGGGNPTKYYTLYFFIQFSKAPASVGVWSNGTVADGQKALTYQASQGTQSMGGFAKFTTTQGEKIQMKIGVSFRSIANATAFVQSELPDFDLASASARARSVWNDKLSTILVETADANLKKMFYTSLYRSMIMPRDRTGDHPTWPASAPYWDDQYCVWDTFRSKFPLMMLIDEDMVTGNINGFIERKARNGMVKDAFIAGIDALNQGGDNPDNIIAEAYMKSIAGVDWSAAFDLLKFQAETQRDHFDVWGGSETDHYGTLGWSVGTNGSSRTLEFALNDFAASQVAKGLGHDTEATAWSNRSSNWTKIFNPSLSTGGFSGWADARNADGSFGQVNPALPIGSYAGAFYEATPYEYSFFVPHDYAALIKKMGGPAQFVQRLENGFTKAYFDMGNEPGFLDPFAFCYAARPDRASYYVRKLMSTHFDGAYPGNEDSGAMSAWFVFAAMGIFPIAGSDVYVIHGPSLSKTTLQLKNGRTFTIVGTNASSSNVYVQSATLNGQPLDRCWLRDSEIKSGGTLDLTMGANPSSWAKSGPLPPSLSTDGIPDRSLPADAVGLDGGTDSGSNAADGAAGGSDGGSVSASNAKSGCACSIPSDVDEHESIALAACGLILGLRRKSAREPTRRRV